MDNDENRDKIEIETFTVDVNNPDNIAVYAGPNMETWQQMEARLQRESDEAIVRAVIEVLNKNEDLRRELMQALGIQENNP